MINKANLIEYIEKLIKIHVPSVDNLRKSHHWLIDQINQGKGPFPLRHFRNSMLDKSISFYPKVNIFEHPNIPFLIIASDNEANSSFYALIRDNWTDTFNNLSMLELLQKQLICIGICRRNVTTDVSRNEFMRLGIQGTMNSHPSRVALHGLKLYHISDAGRLTDLRKDKIKSITDEMKVRIYRLLSPLNVIPYPNVASGQPMQEFIDDNTKASEIGETTDGKRLFAAVLWRHLQGSGAGDLFADWMENSGVDYQIDDLKSLLKRYSDTKVTIIRSDDRPKRSIEKREKIPLSNQNGLGLPSVRIFEIQPSSTGRFHLTGFGKSTGGINRDIKFIFRVFDEKNQIIAESHPHTAAELGIAAAGRQDYDRDQFRQSDFFVNGKANSSIARRVRWK